MFVPLTVDQMAERILAVKKNWVKGTLYYWATHPHYTTHTIEKKRALEKSIFLDEEDVPAVAPKVRLISEPAPALKFIQNWILQFVLNPACESLLPCVHGCVVGRSTVTNARPHVGCLWKIHMDLRDFFPTVTTQRVFGLFRKVFCYDKDLSWLLSNLCTWNPDPEKAKAPMDGPKTLPQGSPTSPAIANLIATGLDIHLLRLVTGMGGYYTRYVDDLTFSFRRPMSPENKMRFITTVASIVERCGFVVNAEKTSVVGRGARMVVTGVVVNTTTSIPKKFRSNLRAAMHHARLELPTADKASMIEGRLSYVHMVCPTQARTLVRSSKG